MKKILVIEDEQSIAHTITHSIGREGFSAVWSERGLEGLELLRQGGFALAVLDIGLPDVSGFELCKTIRSFSQVPIIFLTARDEEIDKIVGLEIGADDYVTKPFSPSERVARVDAVYRRVALAAKTSEGVLRDELSLGDFTLVLRNRVFLKNGSPIELTQVEFQIMEYFFSNPGKALERGDILKHVWGGSYVGEEKIVDVNIRRLRMKVEDEPSNPKHIVTGWGLGYRWDI